MILIKTSEVCDMLGVSPNTIRSMVERGELRALKIGNQLRFRRDDIWTYIKENTINAE